MVFQHTCKASLAHCPYQIFQALHDALSLLPKHLYLAVVENIVHSKTKSNSPRTNGICKRFHSTIKNQFIAEPTLIVNPTAKTRLFIRSNLRRSFIWLRFTINQIVTLSFDYAVYVILSAEFYRLEYVVIIYIFLRLLLAKKKRLGHIPSNSHFDTHNRTLGP